MPSRDLLRPLDLAPDPLGCRRRRPSARRSSCAATTATRRLHDRLMAGAAGQRHGHRIASEVESAKIRSVRATKAGRRSTWLAPSPACARRSRRARHARAAGRAARSGAGRAPTSACDGRACGSQDLDAHLPDGRLVGAAAVPGGAAPQLRRRPSWSRATSSAAWRRAWPTRPGNGRMKYLAGYPPALRWHRCSSRIAQGQLGAWLLARYPRCPRGAHRQRAVRLRQASSRRSSCARPSRLSEGRYDSKLHVDPHALGTHTTISRVQGEQAQGQARDPRGQPVPRGAAANGCA